MSAPVLIIEKGPKMKSAIRVIVFVLAVIVTLPQSAPAQRANDIVVCSGSNLNCYYAPAHLEGKGGLRAALLRHS